MGLKKLSVVGLAASTCLLVGTAALAQQLVLPPANALTTGTYGDFQVQSLELNAKCQAAGEPLCNPSGPYPVQSSPGQIADYLLILQGGSTALNYPSPLGPGLVGDNAFVPPSGAGSSTFVMSAANEPTPTFTGDRIGTWEVQLGALLKYLTQPSGQVADLVFLFDNNQQGSGFNQFQYAWATASIRDSAGNVVGPQCYGLFGGTGYGGGTCANPTPVAPTFAADGSLISAGDYVALATDFCVNKAPPYDTYKLGLAGNNGDCAPDAGHPAGGYFVSNNLGQNNAEFAAYNTSLQSFFLANAAAHATDWTLSVNIRLANLNDGNEQVWICSACGLNRLILIPEPASLALVGLALAGLGVARRRRV